jgi:site-specific DNA recombinase
MQAQHSHGAAYYRCRYPLEYALTNKINHPRNVIIRENTLTPSLDTWLAQEFSPLQRRHTITKILEQAALGAPEPPADSGGPTVAELDAKLDRYRAALDAGADPAVVAGWIADTRAERERAVQRKPSPPAPTNDIANLTEEQIVDIVEELGSVATALRNAAPEHKLEVYRSLGLRLTYHPETQTVQAQVDLAAHRWDSDRVRRGT